MKTDAEKLNELLSGSIQDGSFRKAVLSKPVQKTGDAVSRIDVRPVNIRRQAMLQFTSRVGNQESHQNFSEAEAIEQFAQTVGHQFRDLRLCTSKGEWQARHNRRGVCTVKTVSTSAASRLPVAEHNREREYLIPDGQPVPFLVSTGIMNSRGKVLAKHYRKFRQINRYVEFIDDVLPHLPRDEPIRVVDFGCGKSYLTFAAHYFLTSVRNRSVQMTGLDRRSDVVQTCTDIARSLRLDSLKFEEGDIAAYQPQQQIHLAISLHACDTATDDALAMAVKWKTNVILAVPCCQHELATSLSRDSLPLLSRHGILHERFASLATDAMRASVLDTVGYRTKVVEFIDTEHTPKNLLIRAIRRSEVVCKSDLAVSQQQLQAFSADLGLRPLQLQKKLEEYKLWTSQADANVN